MVQSTILKEISRIKILDFALSVKGDVAPILKNNFKEHQITTGGMFYGCTSLLKNNFKELKIATSLPYVSGPRKLKNKEHEHQITSGQTELNRSQHGVPHVA